MNNVEEAKRAIALLDLTELGDKATEADVTALCEKAKGRGDVPPVAAVCVWSRHVSLAKGLLAAPPSPLRGRAGDGGGSAGHGAGNGATPTRSSARSQVYAGCVDLPARRGPPSPQGGGIVAPIRVATVVNFPSGDAPGAAVLAEVEQALVWGADEIDLVIPYKAVLAGNTFAAVDMVAQVKAALSAGVSLKVIFESGLFPDSATLVGVAEPIVLAGADFLKTSTGKVPQGASLAAAQDFLEVIRRTGRPVGIKPSGGIRTLADAKAYLDLADTMMGPGWATPRNFRFGASSLWDALAAIIEGRDMKAGTGY